MDLSVQLQGAQQQGCSVADVDVDAPDGGNHVIIRVHGQQVLHLELQFVAAVSALGARYSSKRGLLLVHLQTTPLAAGCGGSAAEAAARAAVS